MERTEPHEIFPTLTEANVLPNNADDVSMLAYFVDGCFRYRHEKCSQQDASDAKIALFNNDEKIVLRDTVFCQYLR